MKGVKDKDPARTSKKIKFILIVTTLSLLICFNHITNFDWDILFASNRTMNIELSVIYRLGACLDLGCAGGP